jgi:Tol biopolymer transport system component
VQLTNSSDPNSLSAANGIDDAGIWVAFQSNANLDGTHPLGVSDIWRVRADGSGLQALTSGAAGYSSDYADISGDGSAVCFNSTQDFTGGNPDHNGEIFLWTSSGIRQLTSTTDGYCYYPRLSRDGHWVYFLSSAPIFEANPGTANRLYRVNVSSGSVERADGLGFEAPYYSPAGGEDGINIPSVDDTGIRAVHAQSVNSTRSNPDFFQEVFLYDYTKAPAITVSSGPAPTRVSWDVETGPVRYDVIRGDTANLSINGSSVNLGAVQCVKNDSPVNSTESSDDGLTPAPGHVFFYVYRGSQGLSAGPGSYGQGTGGKERLAGSGDCQP